MTAEAIEKELIEEVAAILSVDPASIKPDAQLHTLGVDSMRFVEVLVFIEKAFNLELIESGLTREDFRTIHSLAECIRQELKT
jgi:acyl carrier protein